MIPAHVVFSVNLNCIEKKEILDKLNKKKSLSNMSSLGEAIKTREILTHHYIEIDSETIFDICKNKIDRDFRLINIF